MPTQPHRLSTEPSTNLPQMETCPLRSLRCCGVVQNVKLAGLWFLKDQCSVLESILELSQADTLSMAACCVNPRATAAIAAS